MICRCRLIKIFLIGLNFCFLNVYAFNLTDYEQLLNHLRVDILTTGKLDRDFMNNIRKVNLTYS